MTHTLCNFQAAINNRQLTSKKQLLRWLLGWILCIVFAVNVLHAHGQSIIFSLPDPSENGYEVLLEINTNSLCQALEQDPYKDGLGKDCFARRHVVKTLLWGTDLAKDIEKLVPEKALCYLFERLIIKKNRLLSALEDIETKDPIQAMMHVLEKHASREKVGATQIERFYALKGFLASSNIENMSVKDAVEKMIVSHDQHQMRPIFEIR